MVRTTRVLEDLWDWGLRGNNQIKIIRLHDDDDSSVSQMLCIDHKMGVRPLAHV